MKFYSENEARQFIDECEKNYRAEINKCALSASKMPGIRYIALSGPTCSGKTTTAEILVSDLNGYGFDTRVISIDHFYRSRASLISEAKKMGVPTDMDSVKAIDLDALKAFISGLEKGEKTFLPYYDFTLGERSGGEYIEPNDRSLYIFEGIQAFYPEVLSLFDSKRLLRVFISVGKELVSDGGSLSPREQRLLRRILRDSKFRGTDILSTLDQWDEVVKNELLHIDPYKELADVVIDSTMPYESCVMKNELLKMISTIPESEMKERFTRVLSSVGEIREELVPSDSVIREFIG